MASNFSRVNSVLFQRRLADMFAFIRDRPDSLKKILNHISNPAIAELLLKFITLEDLPDGSEISEWLTEQGLIDFFIDQLNPNLSTETHSVAAQALLDIIAISYQNVTPDILNGSDYISENQSESNLSVKNVCGNSLMLFLKSRDIMDRLLEYMLVTDAENRVSTLTNCVNIIMELIRRYCSEIEQVEYQQHKYLEMKGPPPSEAKLRYLATDLNSFLCAIGDKIQDLANLLKAEPKENKINTTMGLMQPLGPERLKLCELFAEILHLQYMNTSTPFFEKLIPEYLTENNNDSTILSSTTEPLASPISDSIISADAPSPLSELLESTKKEELMDTENQILEQIKKDTQISESQTESESKIKDSDILEKDNNEINGISKDLSEVAITSTVSDKADKDKKPSRVNVPKGVVQELVLITNGIVENGVIEKCIELFFEFPWNNFLHSVIYDLIAKGLNTYSYAVLKTALKEDKLENNRNSREEEEDEDDKSLEIASVVLESELGIAQMENICNSSRRLVLAMYKNGKLIERIIESQKLNDQSEIAKGGLRLGYMGHISYISDETCKLIEKCKDDLVKYSDVFENNAWDEYVNGPLQITRNRDNQEFGVRVGNGDFNSTSGLLTLGGDVDQQLITGEILSNIGNNFYQEGDSDILLSESANYTSIPTSNNNLLSSFNGNDVIELNHNLDDDDDDISNDHLSSMFNPPTSLNQLINEVDIIDGNDDNIISNPNTFLEDDIEVRNFSDQSLEDDHDTIDEDSDDTEEEDDEEDE